MAWGTSEWTLFVVNVLAVLGNTVVAVWLKIYVKAKEELKDTQIQNIRTIVESKDAHIDLLTKQAAPALAEYVNKMSASLNLLATDLQTYKKKVEEFEMSSRAIGLKEQQWELERAALTDLNDKLIEYVDLLKERTTEFSNLGLFLRPTSGLLNALVGTAGIDTGRASLIDPAAGSSRLFAQVDATENDAFRPVKKTPTPEPSNAEEPNKKKPGFTL
jgi:hypothetical protein